uniref:NADH-ubiquinone oxidoreductase chain 3 n=1 Tax=Caryophyllaeus balticus TaxID=2773719 RepID=G8FGZ8_9CEST|nr:NADH dehydrogenase subunit 3 [Khawia baltica]
MVLLVGLVVVFFVLVVLILGWCSGILSGDCSSGSSWASPYECGFIPSSMSFDSFGFSYMSLLVFFVVFDLEISLLLNMPEQDILFHSFVYYLLFIVILSVGFLFEAIMGYVRWGY